MKIVSRGMLAASKDADSANPPPHTHVQVQVLVSVICILYLTGVPVLQDFQKISKINVKNFIAYLKGQE